MALVTQYNWPHFVKAWHNIFSDELHVCVRHNDEMMTQVFSYTDLDPYEARKWAYTTYNELIKRQNALAKITRRLKS